MEGSSMEKRHHGRLYTCWSGGSDNFYQPCIGKGLVLFTGPDGVCDHKVAVLEPNRYVGIGTMSQEGTSELSYLWRAAQTTAHPQAKCKTVGEIGWNWNDGKVRQNARQGFQKSEFRQHAEKRNQHLYQNPWYPHPKSMEYKLNRYGRELRPHEQEEMRLLHRRNTIESLQAAAATRNAKKNSGKRFKLPAIDASRCVGKTVAFSDSASYKSVSNVPAAEMAA